METGQNTSVEEIKTVHEAGLKKLRRVLLIVLVLCGGNAIGILLGVFCWKRTGSHLLGVAVMLAVTLVAFLMVMAMSLHSLNKAKKEAQERACD